MRMLISETVLGGPPTRKGVFSLEKSLNFLWILLRMFRKWSDSPLFPQSGGSLRSLESLNSLESLENGLF